MPGRSRYPHPVRPQQGRCAGLRPRDPARFPAGERRGRVRRERNPRQLVAIRMARCCGSSRQRLKVCGIKPVPIATPGADRYAMVGATPEIPAYIYGCAPDGMASPTNPSASRNSCCGCGCTFLPPPPIWEANDERARTGPAGTAESSEAKSVAFLQALLRAPLAQPARRHPSRGTDDWCWSRSARRGFDPTVIAPRADLPNIIASSMEPAPGRHLGAERVISTLSPPTTANGAQPL